MSMSPIDQSLDKAFDRACDPDLQHEIVVLATFLSQSIDLSRVSGGNT